MDRQDIETRRADNQVWNGAEDYGVRSDFHAFDPEGGADLYFNTVIGLVHHYYDFRRFKPLFNTFQSQLGGELYTDLSFITTRQEIGEEASAVFNNMALQRLTSEADTMLVAPLRFKSVLLEEMDRQIALAMQGKPASIILKNNSINDPQIIDKISEASCAGVRVDMIVRGISCERAGVPGRTENKHIRSQVARY